ncbi:hypothetical protein [Variovorax sp. OV329]|uniref:hypothetical protein n=1 Tax=Variovorax sp. OV329 TaxID=1882825 RepID=UPI001113E8CD|nr:hypothetical protein [Variovorax sp. OV329]
MEMPILAVRRPLYTAMIANQLRRLIKHQGRFIDARVELSEIFSSPLQFRAKLNDISDGAFKLNLIDLGANDAPTIPTIKLQGADQRERYQLALLQGSRGRYPGSLLDRTFALIPTLLQEQDARLDRRMGQPQGQGRMRTMKPVA